MLAAKLDLARETAAATGALLLAAPRHALAPLRRRARCAEFAALERDAAPVCAPEGPPEVVLRDLVLSCGDASGEAHALALVEELRRRHPGLRVRGFGGSRLAAAGMEVWEPLADLNVMGFRAVAGLLPLFFRSVERFAAELRREPPDAVVLVDYPGLNQRLLRIATHRGVPVVDHLAPQTWAWAPWRARDFVRADALTTLFPFEADWWRRRGGRARFVGHPAGDSLHAVLASPPPRPAEVAGDAPLIGLMPGSRRREVEDNLPNLLAAAELLAARDPRRRFVLPHRRPELAPLLDALLADAAVPVTRLPGRFHEVLPHLTGALCVSGTASLEAALAGVPTVVTYAVPSRLGAAFARHALSVPHVAAVNLLAGEALLPERVGRLVRPEDLAADLEALLEPDRREALVARLHELRRCYAAPGTAARAAGVVEEAVRRRRTEGGPTRSPRGR